MYDLHISGVPSVHHSGAEVCIGGYQAKLTLMAYIWLDKCMALTLVAC